MNDLDNEMADRHKQDMRKDIDERLEELEKKLEGFSEQVKEVLRELRNK